MSLSKERRNNTLPSPSQKSKASRYSKQYMRSLAQFPKLLEKREILIPPIEVSCSKYLLLTVSFAQQIDLSKLAHGHWYKFTRSLSWIRESCNRCLHWSQEGNCLIQKFHPIYYVQKFHPIIYYVQMIHSIYMAGENVIKILQDLTKTLCRILNCVSIKSWNEHSRFMILRLLVKTLQNILTDNFIDTGVYFIDTNEIST